MLIKEKDDLAPMIEELEDLRKTPGLTPKQKDLIDDDSLQGTSVRTVVH